MRQRWRVATRDPTRGRPLGWARGRPHASARRTSHSSTRGRPRCSPLGAPVDSARGRPLDVARDRLLAKLLKQVFECFTQRLALIRGKRAEPFLVDDELLIRIFEWLGRATSLVLRRWRVLLSDRFVDVLFHVAIAPILL